MWIFKNKIKKERMNEEMNLMFFFCSLHNKNDHLPFDKSWMMRACRRHQKKQTWIILFVELSSRRKAVAVIATSTSVVIGPLNEKKSEENMKEQREGWVLSKRKQTKKRKKRESIKRQFAWHVSFYHKQSAVSTSEVN